MDIMKMMMILLCEKEFYMLFQLEDLLLFIYILQTEHKTKMVYLYMTTEVE